MAVVVPRALVLQQLQEQRSAQALPPGKYIRISLVTHNGRLCWCRLFSQALPPDALQSIALAKDRDWRPSVPWKECFAKTLAVQNASCVYELPKYALDVLAVREIMGGQ
eukprot:scaffold144618_cov17-Tisochrysis_lutea.AAC.1